MDNELNNSLNDGHGIRRNTSHPNSILEHYGQWLLSIPRDDIPSLAQTNAYASFIEAFQNLERAHRKTIIQNQQRSYLEDSSISFLQHMALDDIILRIFEFLPCATLVKTSETCHRFRILARRSAKQRTVQMEGRFYLVSEMQLLRAKEQIDGIIPECKPVVRVPLLGLQKRIYVSGSGDEEFNGIYYCTGSNGNGFLFTKPRHEDEWTGQDAMMGMELDEEEEEEEENAVGALEENLQRIPHQRLIPEQRAANNREINDEGEETYPLYPGRVPRCIIGKRFSNETILWYMSKEVLDENGKVKQLFSFWAKLMVIGEGTPDICRYPSQTSILSRNGEPAWQSLSSTRTVTPPVVELLD